MHYIKRFISKVDKLLTDSSTIYITKSVARILDIETKTDMSGDLFQNIETNW